MMHSRWQVGTSPRCRKTIVATTFLFLPLFVTVSQGVPHQQADCSKWIDSMVVAGKQGLRRNDMDAARHFFTSAYRCGMSKDSMHFFAAEIYLRTGAIDTALTFNWVVEKSRKINPSLVLEQRSRIFRAAGWKRAADSIAALCNRSGRHDIAATVSGSRSGLAIGGITFIPQLYPFSFPDADIDDAGKCGLAYRWSRWGVERVRKIFLQFDANTEMKVPTRYSFDESNDTLLRTISVTVGAGDFPSMPELVINYRARIHKDGKTDHYSKGQITLPIGRTGMLLAGNEIKLIRNEGVDDSRTDLSYMRIPPGRRLHRSYGISAGHHFAKSDLYQNKLDTTGLYRPIPLGFLDSLVPGSYYGYYRDKDRKVPYQSKFLDEYWAGQPLFILFEPLPEHDLNASLRSSIRFTLPLKVDLTIFNILQGVFYPRKLRWYAAEASTVRMKNDLPQDVKTKYSVVYNNADGNYYLNTDRSDLQCPSASLEKLKHYEKRRIDGYITFTALIEKRFKTIGKIYFIGAYLKGFSMLDDNDPVARLDYSWELSAGWKKDLMWVKK